MTTTDFSQINEEDIHSGKYVFRDVFDVGPKSLQLVWMCFPDRENNGDLACKWERMKILTMPAPSDFSSGTIPKHR